VLFDRTPRREAGARPGMARPIDATPSNLAR
jgi:hypothetical protein